MYIIHLNKIWGSVSRFMERSPSLKILTPETKRMLNAVMFMYYFLTHYYLLLILIDEGKG